MVSFKYTLLIWYFMKKLVKKVFGLSYFPSEFLKFQLLKQSLPKEIPETTTYREAGVRLSVKLPVIRA